MSLSKAEIVADELTIIATIIGLILTRSSKTEEDAIILANFLSNIGDTILTQIAQQRALQILLTGTAPLQQSEEIQPISLKEKI